MKTVVSMESRTSEEEEAGLLSCRWLQFSASWSARESKDLTRTYPGHSSPQTITKVHLHEGYLNTLKNIKRVFFFFA